MFPFAQRCSKSCMTLPVAELLLLLVMLTILSVPSLFGQTATGGVNGTIVDQSGAAVPGVKVTLVNQQTAAHEQTTTNPSGNFALINVLPGTYLLRVQASGFKTVQTVPFVVRVNQTITQQLTLTVGAVTQVVQVSAAANLIEPTTTELGSVIGEKVTHDLPLNGRNFTELMLLTPGASPISTSQATITTEDSGVSAIPGSAWALPSLNGAENREEVFYLDGISNSDYRGSAYGVLPPVDSIEEFKVVSHDDQTQFGGVLGGAINIVTKSGTNQFHGSAYEFVRNNVFDARNPFTDALLKSPPAFRQNQFGATLGGPIIHNKTFFFFSWDSWRYTTPQASYSYVPTPAELNGDFSDYAGINPIFNPYTTRPDPSLPGAFIRDPFPGNQIPSQLINPQMQKFLQAYSVVPNVTGIPGENFLNNFSHVDNSNTFLVKANHNFAKGDTAFVRWARQGVYDNSPLGGNETNTSMYHGTNGGGGWDHIFSPNAILDVRGGWLSKPYTFTLPASSLGASPAKAAGFSGTDQYGGLYAALSGVGPWGGPASTIGNAFPYYRDNPDWDFTANLNWMRGNHNLQFGFEYIWMKRVQLDDEQTFTFNGSLTQNPESPTGTGATLADALLGLPVAYLGELVGPADIRLSLDTYAFYMHDVWRVKPRLTVDLGLRYDLPTTPMMDNNRLSNGIDILNREWIIGATAYPPACNPPQDLDPCIPGGIQSVPDNDHIRLGGAKNFMDPTQYTDFGPRIGVAYRLTKATALRAGYGLFWDDLSARTQTAQNDVNVAQWPWTPSFSGVANSVLGQPLTSITSLVGAFPTPVPAANPWNPGANGCCADDPNLKNDYAQEFNFDVQHQFGQKSMVSIAYVGSRSGQLAYTGRANGATQAIPDIVKPNGSLVPPPRTVEDAFRPMPWMGSNIVYTQSIGTGSYDALEVSLQRHLANGLTSSLSYTWGKCISNSSGFYGVENGAGSGFGVQDYYNPQSNRGLCGYNIPNNFVWYTLYELPVGRGKRWLRSGPASWFLGNWQLNYILSAHSGQAYSLGVNAGDPANIEGSLNTLSGYARPNVIGNPYAGPLPPDVEFNPAAFSIPQGAFGNFGSDVLKAPGVLNMDISLFKNIPLGSSETRSLQVRFEAFNAFNIQNWGVPSGTTIGVPGNVGVGLVDSLAYGTLPRQFQFGARIVF